MCVFVGFRFDDDDDDDTDTSTLFVAFRLLDDDDGEYSCFHCYNYLQQLLSLYYLYAQKHYDERILSKENIINFTLYFLMFICSASTLNTSWY